VGELKLRVESSFVKETASMTSVPNIIEDGSEQRVRVPSARRAEYGEERSFAAVGCLSYSYSYSAERYSYSTAVPGCLGFLGVSSLSGEPSMVIEGSNLIEVSEEQRLRVRVPSAGRTEYEDEGSFAAVGCLSYSYSYSAQRYSYSLAVPGCSCFLGVSSLSGEPTMVIEALKMIEPSEEQRVRVRVPSASRTEYEEEGSCAAVGCLSYSYSYSAERYSYSLAVPGCLGFWFVLTSNFCSQEYR